MSRSEDVQTAIWRDTMFHKLSPHAKLVYFWCFTNPGTGMAGLYDLSLPHAAFETGLKMDELAAALRELQGQRFVFFADGVLWVRTRVKHLKPKSPQMAKSVAKNVGEFPIDHPLVQRFLEAYGNDPWLRDFLPKRENSIDQPTVTNSSMNTGELVNVDGRHPDVQGKGKGKDVVVRSSSERSDVQGNPDVRLIFEHWQASCSKPKARLTTERQQKVQARLREGYSVADITIGIDGAARNPPIVEGVVYDDLVSICRNGAQLERYMQRANNVVPIARNKPGSPGDMIVRIRAAQAARRQIEENAG